MIISGFSESAPQLHAFCFNQHLFKQHQGEIARIKQKLNNTPRLKFCYVKVIYFFYLYYHTKLIWGILTYVQKTNVRFNEIIWLIIMKMKIEMKKWSHKYDLNTTWLRHGYEYTMISVVCNKQHLNNIWINKKVKQQWGWEEKKRCLQKKRVIEPLNLKEENFYHRVFQRKVIDEIYRPGAA